jgi:hypothetical protein
MRTCLIFGAGATLANALHFHSERRTDRNPPLDGTFFNKIRALEVAVPTDLRRYASTLPTGSPFEASSGTVRMEEFFKDLFFDFVAEPNSKSQIAGAYTALIDIYRRVISDTTDWLIDPKRSGAPVGRLIAEIAKSSTGVTLMTFNQDLVIENEIYKRASLRSQWCIEHGYGTFSENRGVMSTTAANLFPEHTSGCDGGARLKILKLHGSINWLVRMNGRKPSRRILAGLAKPPPVQISRRRAVPSQLRFTKPRAGAGRTAWYLWPVIIPPIYNKQALIQSFIPNVWDDARTELMEADRIVFFGYSLPQADIEAEKLFQRGVFANKKLRNVEVINPDPASAYRYAKLMPNIPLRWYPNISSFLRDHRLA